MSKNLIDIEVIEPRILSVIIKNHKKRNALSDSIKKELEKIALDLRDNTEIVGVILSGERGVFSSGNDLAKSLFALSIWLYFILNQNQI